MLLSLTSVETQPRTYPHVLSLGMQVHQPNTELQKKKITNIAEMMLRNNTYLSILIGL
jgi:hypothetical protein